MVSLEIICWRDLLLVVKEKPKLTAGSEQMEHMTKERKLSF